MDEVYEAEIIRKVLRGDPQPFGDLVREYQGPVYNLMLRTVKSRETAEDLAQETFTRAYARLETFKVGNRFFPWLYSVALNVARDHMRKEGRDFHVFMENTDGMAEATEQLSAHQAADVRMDSERIFRFVRHMAPRYREALMLRFRHDLSMKEIAQALDITVSGAKMRVSRGIDMIRQAFKEVSDDR